MVVNVKNLAFATGCSTWKYDKQHAVDSCWMGLDMFWPMNFHHLFLFSQKIYQIGHPKLPSTLWMDKKTPRQVAALFFHKKLGLGRCHGISEVCLQALLKMRRHMAQPLSPWLPLYWWNAVSSPEKCLALAKRSWNHARAKHEGFQMFWWFVLPVERNCGCPISTSSQLKDKKKELY